MPGGALGDKEFLADLAIRQARAQEGRHLAFATSKLRSCGLHCGAGVAPAGPDCPRTSFPPCAAARAFSPATKMVCLTAGRPFARLDDSRSVKPSNRSNVCKTFIAGSIPAVASDSRKSRSREAASHRFCRPLSWQRILLPKKLCCRDTGPPAKSKGLQDKGLRGLASRQRSAR